MEDETIGAEAFLRWLYGFAYDEIEEDLNINNPASLDTMKEHMSIMIAAQKYLEPELERHAYQKTSALVGRFHNANNVAYHAAGTLGKIFATTSRTCTSELFSYLANWLTLSSLIFRRCRAADGFH